MEKKKPVSSDEFDKIFDEDEENIFDYVDLDKAVVKEGEKKAGNESKEPAVSPRKYPQTAKILKDGNS
jgi:hypothetical protein